MGTIYKIVNDINDKIYIGKTVTPLYERWSKHLYAAKTEGTHLYRAMRKYGFDHFSILPLEENIADDLLNEREIFWIRELNTIKNGYNTTIGGDGRKWIDREKVIELYNNGLSAKQISEELGVWYSSIIDVLKEVGLYETNEVTARGKLSSSLKQTDRKVLQYDENLNLIAVYNSPLEASLKTGFNKVSIKTAFETKNGYKGFFWIREGDSLPIARKIKTCESKKIGQYDKEDNLIKIYNSASEAGKDNNIDPSSIIKVCKGKRKTTGGYKWRYEE